VCFAGSKLTPWKTKPGVDVSGVGESLRVVIRGPLCHRPPGANKLARRFAATRA
jgi:hypothetical protein